MELTTNHEKSFLVFLETRCVDYGGLIDGRFMNNKDIEIAKRWHEAGFIQFGRIAFKDLDNFNSHWCALSEAALAEAYKQRHERTKRAMAKVKVERLGYVETPPAAPQPAQATQLPPDWAKNVSLMWQCVRKHDSSIPSDDLDLMRDMLLKASDCTTWADPSTVPRSDCTVLVKNARGQVAPFINGVVYNNAGTPWDWDYGEQITGWTALPSAEG